MEQAVPDTPKRRRSPRVPVNNHPDLSAALRDVGLGGFALELPEQLGIGTVHDFDLRMGSASHLVVRARVAHTEPEAKADGRTVYVTGLEFLTDLTPERRIALRRTA